MVYQIKIANSETYRIVFPKLIALLTMAIVKGNWRVMMGCWQIPALERIPHAYILVP